MFDNIILNTDSYKHSHYLQYPPGVDGVYSYIESRGGEFPSHMFFGLQAFLKEYLVGPQVLPSMVDEAEKLVTAHGLPFNREGWEYIMEKRVGRLPVIIRALPEGLVVPHGTPVLTIENTDPKCFWLTSFLETAILRAIWYPSTVGTVSYQAKRIIKEYLEVTCDNPEAELPFKLHDFGARGVSSLESAALGGLAHLVNFKGTDTLSALIAAQEWYNAEGPVGFSIPAAEHSTITSWGREQEVVAFANMVNKFGGPGKLLAVVSDSYDIYNAVKNLWGGSLKDTVLKNGARVVIRPDSGNPVKVVLDVVTELGQTFGVTVNSKGFKVLHPSVRVIQGDGVNLKTIGEILAELTKFGWSAENVAFGMGGGLLQGSNRDTLKWAMKCSAVRIFCGWKDVYKDPITDPGKASKRGRFAVVPVDGKLVTLPEEGNQWQSLLRPVYSDGELLKDWTFDEVRANSEKEYL